MTSIGGSGAVDEARAKAREVRGRVRCGEVMRTAGVAPGMVQGNVAILPADWAHEFLSFCRANPKPCPLLAVSEPGDPMLPELGHDIDIRTDVPAYRVFHDGVETAEVSGIEEFWRDDLVTFVLGCSFSFEEALVSSGVNLRHLSEGTDVSVYRTNVPTKAAGRFAGPLVVSMRPLSPANAIRAIQITSRFPGVHGAPVHFGDPEAIGIRDIARPDWGDAQRFEPGETPVFWACGVTPQAVVAHAKPPFCITHKASHMLITDRLNAEFSVL